MLILIIGTHNLFSLNLFTLSSLSCLQHLFWFHLHLNLVLLVILVLGVSSSPPAPEGWDKDITQQRAAQPHHQPNTSGLFTNSSTLDAYHLDPTHISSVSSITC